MNRLRGYFRIISSAVVLSCYLLGASVTPIIEGLHFVSHYISDYQSDQEIHSFFDHDGRHSHKNLEALEDIVNQQSHAPNSKVETEVDKKNQICQNEWLSLISEARNIACHSVPLSEYHSQINNIPTPPPEA